MGVILALLAALSIWDYPGRYPQHEQLRRQFVTAVREGDTPTMLETCQKGVKLLPDDPTWHYNLACSLAYCEKKEPALDELEKAIDLGFRKPDEIAADSDLKQLAKESRFKELVDYAKKMKERPLLTGPMANVPATGVFGHGVALGEQNVIWNFDYGCFEANMQLAIAGSSGNDGDLYMNRDHGHATIRPDEFPGLTFVKLEKEARDRHLDYAIPNMLFPYPVFGNSSTAHQGQFWRSNPRSLMTSKSDRIGMMAKFYLSNQVWVFPSAGDTPPVGTNGDVFASIAPYWLTTAGRSWSDLPYLRGALLASKSLKPTTKNALVKDGLLAPTIMTLIRKSLKGVETEDDYITAKAHPTALPPGGLITNRLVKLASELKVNEIPPLVPLSVGVNQQEAYEGQWPETTYATAFACAFVLRSDLMDRKFMIRARGADEYRFVQTHGAGVKVQLKPHGKDVVEVFINRAGMSPTNRVDIAVFGRNVGTGWGAPSYVSFARMDPKAAYSDPVLTILDEPEEAKPK